MTTSPSSHAFGSLEVRALRRSVRDMIALADLRASWLGQEPGQIAQRFAQALLSAMDLRFVLLRCSTASIDSIETIRAAEPAQVDEVRRLVDRVLAGRGRVHPPARLHLPAPGDRRPLSVWVDPLGEGGELGTLVMATERMSFPNEYDRSLIAIGTMQLTGALREHEQFARWRLGELSRRLVKVQEDERRTIARELHDEVGQILTGLKLMLEAGSRPGATLDLALLRDLSGQLLERVRDLSLDLRPPMLDDLGLVPTLLWHFERYRAQTRIHVRFQHRGLSVRLPAEIEIAVFRIIQEALTNVARHAGVDEVSVELWLSNDRIVLHVEDEGRGFDPARLEGPANGLTGMRERASLAGGSWEISSRPGEGARLSAELPVVGGDGQARS
jgi:signal transduction histidine kinase